MIVPEREETGAVGRKERAKAGKDLEMGVGG
jgi:hypothetical protein